MLNLGLALQQPYESKYNAYRRFLIANGKKSLGDIRDELRNKFESSYSRYFSVTPKISTFHLFQILDHHTQYGELELDTRNIVKNIPDDIRNCPDCARSCFHSDLYQLPWLALCPIHHQPLVHSCPSCNLSWPKLGELKSRRCKTCGTSYRWDELKESKGFHPVDANSRKLELLDSLINDYKTLTLGTTINLYMHGHNLDRHNSINFNHQLFPSVMSTINPTLTSTFEDYGVNLYKLHCLDLPAQIKPVTPYINTAFHHYDANLKSKRAHDIRKTMELVIKKQIQNQFNITDLTFPRGFYFGEIKYLEGTTYLPILAFGIWKHLIEGKGLINSAIFKNYEPYIPCLLETLIFAEKDIFEIQFSGMIHVEYNAPIEVQTILYKYDLWHTFTDILKYLDAIRYLNNKNDYSWGELAKLVSGVFEPMSDYNQGYAFFLINRKYIRFLYSEMCSSFTLNSFKTIN